MKKVIKAAALGAFALSATLGAAAPADATELRFAVGSPPNSLGDKAANHFKTKLEEYSNGDVTVKVYPLSLLNLLESNNGIRDGIADIATVLWPYFLSEYPETNLIAEAASMSELIEGDRQQATLAYLGAMIEYVALHCPECQAEAKAQNQVFLAGLGTSSYVLQCMKPVSSYEDLQGLRVRAGGAWWSRWLTGMGATPVTMSINETFEGLNQGILDCTASNPGDMTQFGFIDVISDVTVGVPGSSFAFAIADMNLDTWNSLSEENRKHVMHAAAAISGDGIMAYFHDGRENVENKAPAQGIKIHQADEALLAKSREWIAADLDALAASYEERFGIKDAKGKLERLRALVDEWMPRMEGVDDRDALAEVLWQNAYSKIDVNAYGQ
ncbi:C4-dicarboxylate TRAP transporter substrate-binding protein [Albimonas sp. CAU 1670]|uniref:C4-dicarboxylate TRAP transporter substrate-binding protein n=1 Tax=Albimonas sp. CAU 1670 TaxID=3032599 RepID=UPI0023DB8D75|nr:C4-dicarboxylate TRAP transporter substrate-binding protein [Albimonas sp. CAU 1670]MDF2232454.1 C4-dicarboxylate TRAP transporter substrate-binding protein [Albimonas sp. CAU 1670]